jgi:hypothetical protein
MFGPVFSRKKEWALICHPQNYTRWSDFVTIPDFLRNLHNFPSNTYNCLLNKYWNFLKDNFSSIEIIHILYKENNFDLSNITHRKSLFSFYSIFWGFFFVHLFYKIIIIMPSQFASGFCSYALASGSSLL